MISRLARRPGPPIPILLLTGFLGAGKTTLLNDLLRDDALADTVVLINEFGEIGLDHLLVERIDGDMLLLASGCVCCTIRGDLVNALEDLLRRLDNGRIKPFLRIVIETTGLADPVPILQTIVGHPYFAMRLRLESVVTVVDAVNGLDTLARHAEAVRQVALADDLILGKTDLPQAQEAELRDRVSAINPHARIFRRGAQGIDTRALLAGAGSLSSAAGKVPEEDAGHAHDRHQDHGHHHAPDPTRHGETIRAFTLVRTTPVEKGPLSQFLNLLRHAHGPKLLRMKGLVQLDDDPARPLVVQAVQHVLHPPTRLDAWPDADHRTRLVVITDGLDPLVVETLFAAVSGDIGPDRPDLVALTQNPLAPVASGLLG